MSKENDLLYLRDLEIHDFLETNGRWKEALQLLDGMIERHAKDWLLSLLRAQCLRKLGNHEKAVVESIWLVDHYPERELASVALVHALWNADRIVEVAREIERFIQHVSRSDQFDDDLIEEVIGDLIENGSEEAHEMVSRLRDLKQATNALMQLLPATSNQRGMAATTTIVSTTGDVPVNAGTAQNPVPPQHHVQRQNALAVLRTRMMLLADRWETFWNGPNLTQQLAQALSTKTEVYAK